MGGYRRFRESWGCYAQVVMGGYRRFREIWGCYAQMVMGGSGEVGVVMSRSGVNGLMCGSSMQ